MTPDHFIARWKDNPLTERAGAQAHFDDLCELLGVDKPRDADNYCFERGAKKSGGGDGWADVWKRGHFAWENKKPGRDLDKALKQLTDYALQLDSPPLLVVCDRERIIIHTAFTGYPDEPREIAIEDLRDEGKRQWLRWVFTDPLKLRPEKSTAAITEEAASRFAALADAMRGRGEDADRVAHFLVQCLFCMFAEDEGLLPDNLFTELLNRFGSDAGKARDSILRLFASMNDGGAFGLADIPWFNGGLFKTIDAPQLTLADLRVLRDAAAEMDWRAIDPTIFGTLFERGLGEKRAPLGAHYTDTGTISKLVDPLVREPLLREWEAVHATIEALMHKADIFGKGATTKAEAAARTRAHNDAKKRYAAFLQRLAQFRVLDPACGSGNFLYLALKALRDVEKRAHTQAQELGLQAEVNLLTGPHNILGIEINAFAAELARVTVWIGDIQWCRQNGWPHSINPILKPLDGIDHRDALLAILPSPYGSEAGAAVLPSPSGRGAGGEGTATGEGRDVLDATAPAAPSSGAARHLLPEGEGTAFEPSHTEAGAAVLPSPPGRGAGTAVLPSPPGRGAGGEGRHAPDVTAPAAPASSAARHLASRPGPAQRAGRSVVHAPMAHEQHALTPEGEGKIVEAAWPRADVIVGNPPFIGDKKMRGELGNDYVETLRKVYAGRVPGGADFVCYWFEKARAMIEAGELQAAGLVSTNSIRGGANRKVLERIVETTRIFMAWSDEPWINDGAAVRVSMVGFGAFLPSPSGRGIEGAVLPSPPGKGAGGEGRHAPDATAPAAPSSGAARHLASRPGPAQRAGRSVVHAPMAHEQHALTPEGEGNSMAMLDGNAVAEIHADLTAGEGVNTTQAAPLRENEGTSFIGTQKSGPFDIPGETARAWLSQPNPNGRPNSEVVKPWANGMDITRRPSDTWIVDFGVKMSEDDSSLYEQPFAHLKLLFNAANVRKTKSTSKVWWRHERPRPEMREALKGAIRYIGTPRVSKHRVFAWLPANTIPDCQIVVVARGDDVTFGILQSRFHELWSLSVGTWMGVGNDLRYTPTTTFETFPFPQGLTPRDTKNGAPDIPQARAIANAARKLDALRSAWLNPPEWTDWVITPEEETAGFPKRPVAKPGHEAELKKRTLTNLYNARPAWLALAHEALDKAVAAAYGWPDYSPAMPDEALLRRLLALNKARA